MKNVALWQIASQGPIALEAAEIELEKHLEEWIEQDPHMVETGLEIVGRQLRTEGGLLDLLGIDLQGRWVVIEIKPAALYRETFAQALDYAACIAQTPIENLGPTVDEYLRRRDGDRARTLASILDERGVTRSRGDTPEESGVRICLVGTALHVHLRRVASFLSERTELPIHAVTFQVFALASGERILIRELSETELAPEPAIKVEAVLKRADRSGTGDALRKIHSVATNLGLHPRPWKTSIMYAPQLNRTRCLFTVWADPKLTGKVRIYMASEAVEEFFGIKAAQVTRAVGFEGWGEVDPAEVDSLLGRIKSLLAPHN